MVGRLLPRRLTGELFEAGHLVLDAGQVEGVGVALSGQAVLAEAGVAVNPRRGDLRERLVAAGLPVAAAGAM